MQVICEGLDLAEAVLKVSRAIPSKSTSPILEGIKLVAEANTLTLIATDLELVIEKKIKAEVEIEGETVVPGKFFSEFIKKLTNEKIELILNEKQQLKIKYMDSESSIQCFDGEEFPTFARVDGDYFALPRKDFKNLINQTIFSVALDDSRPILKGCLLEIEDDILSSVALDGYRLALVKAKITHKTNNCRVIIPAKSLSEVAKLLDDSDNIVNIYIQKSFIMVDLEETKIISRLFEGEFINYKQIIASDYQAEIQVNKSQIENSLERASLLSKVGQNNLVKFDIRENNLLITSNSEIGTIKENVNIVLNGKDLTIAFNARYFTEAFKVINEEFVSISFNSPSNPCVIRAIDDKEKFLFLILPVRML